MNTIAVGLLLGVLLIVSPAAAVAQPAAVPAGAQTEVRRLSLEDAVRLALEQNLGIQIERLSPQVQDLAVAQAQASWAPTLTSSFTGNNANNPVNSFLSGGQSSVSDAQVSTSVGLTQLLRWGGNYSVGWSSSRATTTNVFSNYSPTLRSNLTAAVVQPLLRNFKIDNVRQQLELARINRSITDVGLRQTLASTVRDVKSAYWDLVYAVASLAVQRQSLDLARESLRNNRARVEIGTMAPIDVVEAESEVAQRDEAVIVAEAAIRTAEDRLRALILDPATPNFWTLRLEPTDIPAFRTEPVDQDGAVRHALESRTDLQRARKNIESTDSAIKYYKDQTLPELNLEASYGLSGLGGTQFVRGPGFPGEIIGEASKGFGSVLGNILTSDFPTWQVGVSVGYPLGTSVAEANLAKSRLQRSQSEVQIRNVELQVVSQVREMARQVETNLKRVDSTRASRELGERRLEAEQKKFAAGTSTSFFVFQAQRDLALVRNNELKAKLDYEKSRVDFEAIQETALGGTISVTQTTSTTTATPTGSAAVSSAPQATTSQATTGGR